MVLLPSAQRRSRGHAPRSNPGDTSGRLALAAWHHILRRGGVPMRTMLRISMPVEASNRALKEGLGPKLVQQTTEMLKPEAVYFSFDGGLRTAYFYFDMKDASQIPPIVEPWLNGTNARVDRKSVV